MQRAFGLNIPQTLEEVCDPRSLALIVYDMQVGIVKQIENGQQITDRVVQVLEAARAAGIRVFFTRHMSLPKELMGVSQMRMAMAWQRVKSVDEVKPWIAGLMLLPSLVLPWKSALNLQCGMALIWGTFRWLLRMPVVLATAMRQHVQSPASNSRAMLCLRMLRRSALNSGAYSRSKRLLGHDRTRMSLAPDLIR